MITKEDMEKTLKGDIFQNRYRIHGTLTTLSPLHIGTGDEVEIKDSRRKKKKSGTETEKPLTVSTVIKDHRGKPIIPGSTIKGVMRHWLLNVLRGVGESWATIHQYSSDAMNALTQAEQLNMVKSNFSWLELLFGTPLNESKIEVWDAVCKTKDLPPPDALLGWNPVSLTYIDISVAIDPSTGTAAEHLLYHYEVVPPGVEFEFDLTGQNLSRIELGILLLALEGFNSSIYPIQIGARSGRGYGRVRLEIGDIYGLDSTNIEAWIQEMIKNFGEPPQKDVPASEMQGKDAAGYFALPQLPDEEKKKLVKEVKDALLEQMGK